VPKGKLLFINANQFGYSAGHYHYCKYLAESFEIEYVCFDRGRKKMSLSGVSVHYLPFGDKKLDRQFRLLRAGMKHISAFRPDVLFVVYFSLSFLFSTAAVKKKILDIRTGSLQESAFRRNVENSLIRFQSLFFKHCIVLSESLRSLLNISAARTFILPLGSEIFSTKERHFHDLNLLYVGSLDGRRIEETIHGLAKFLKTHSDENIRARYRIVGKGRGDVILEQVIKSKGLGSVVSLEGYKNYEELPVYFDEANVGVAFVPMKTYYQAQPATKIFEYALSGMFTIATDTLENRNFITAENGCICNDTAEGFASGLSGFWEKRQRLNEKRIRESLADYEWHKLVTGKLLPYLKNKA
jgi:glycosyltransferase involved in cell wall biosynthesis